jgi:uncharacterized protein YecA (UPF0149 family)
MKPTVQKFNLRLPVDLMEEAKAQADAIGVSLNAYVLFALSEQVKRARRKLADPAAVPDPETSHTPAVRVGRNDPCPCGSGRKAKHCHPESC